VVPRPAGSWYNSPMNTTKALPPSVLALIALLSASLFLTACHKPKAAIDPAFIASEAAWRADRLARLTRPDGWLTLVGLYWLEPGENPFGSASGNRVILPEAPGVPPQAGVFLLGSDGTVTLRCQPEAGVTLSGQRVDETVVRSDADPGGPDILHAGRVLFYVIRRAEKTGIRIKDPASPARTGFKGLDWYPPDPRWKVTGHLEAFSTPRKVDIATAIGTTEEMLTPGLVRFRLEGKDLALTPLISEPGDTELFIVFADATSGPETYGAGRFLDATLAPDGTVELDFNRAYSPPCAFTPHATCPLPPPENVLPIPIRAGEKSSGSHH